MAPDNMDLSPRRTSNRKPLEAPDLPLVQYACDLYPRRHLQDVVVVACQHLLSTQLRLADQLVCLGADPANLFFLGKSYSSNREVYEALLRRGIYVDPGSFDYDSHQAFDDQFASAVASFVDTVASQIGSRRPRRIVVVDVGGCLLDALAPRLRSGTTPAAGVEQTSSGFAKTAAWCRAFPLIDVAHAAAKRQEGPVLAEVTATKLRSYLQGVGLRSPRVIVAGQGPVGGSLVARLRSEYDVVGFDRDPQRTGLHGTLDRQLASFDVLLGATGSLSARAIDLRGRRTPIHLLSVSSSDREFAAASMRRLAAQSSNPHRHHSVDGVELVNAGFPVNFDGSAISLPEEDVQLVVALMLAAVCEAADAGPTPQTRELSPMVQDQLLRELARMRGR